MKQIDPPSLGGSYKVDTSIKELRLHQKLAHSKLSDLPYDIFIQKTTKSIAKLSALTDKIVTDSIQCKNIITKVYIFKKIRKDQFMNFVSILDNVKSEDFEVNVICVFVYAKLMKFAPRGFLKKVLLKCIADTEILKHATLFGYLVFFLLKKSTSTVLMCFNELIELTTKIFLSKEMTARLIAYDSLNLALKFLERTPNLNSNTININLFKKAQEKLTSGVWHEQHGAFLIFGSIFTNLKSSSTSITLQANELLDSFFSVLNSTELRPIAIYNIVLISKFEKEFFLNQKYFNIIFDELYNDNCSDQISVLSSYSFFVLFKTFPEKIIIEEANEIYCKKIITIIENMLQKSYTIRIAFHIIHEISQRFPFFLKRILNFLKTMLLKPIPISGEITEYMIYLFEKYPVVFDVKIFGPTFSVIISQYDNCDFYNFLALCPFINSPDIIDKLLDKLSFPDTETRHHVPAALLAQIPYDDFELVHKVFHTLFTIALTDLDPLMRCSVVSAFNSNCYKFLTLDEYLNPLTSLANDDSTEVRDAAIQLLGKVAECDPFKVNIILRKMIIKNFYVLDVNIPPKTKAHISRSFYYLFEAAKGILPIYCPTFCDIALRELSIAPLSKLTYFEQRFHDDISKNIISVIKYIALSDISQISSHIQQFVTFFIWRIQQHSTKELKLAIIKTLYVLLTKYGPIKGIDMNQLNSALMLIAAKWNSKKMNLAILKLVGFIGVSDQKTVSDENITTEAEPPQPNDPSYYLHCACTTLLEILDDESLAVNHVSCLCALSNIFCADHEMRGQKFFVRFMPLLIEQVRSTGHPKYIKILDQVCCGAPLPWVLSFRANLIDLVQEMMNISSNSKQLSDIVDIIPTLCEVLKSNAESLMHHNCFHILFDVFTKNMKNDDTYAISLKCFESIISLRHVVENYIYFAYPKLISYLTVEGVVPIVKHKVFEAIIFLLQQNDISEYIPITMRVVMNILLDCNNSAEIISYIMQIIFSLMIKYRLAFSYFISRVSSLIESHKSISSIDKSHYFSIVNDIDNSQKMPSLNDYDFIKIIYMSPNKDSLSINPITNENNNATTNEEIKIDENKIKAAISMQDDETPWNWKEWYHSFVTIFISQCPSPFVSACTFLCKNLFAYAENILNPAFLSVWQKLTDETKILISGCLTQAFLSDSLPNGVRSSIVFLLEFLEHNECHVMISKQVICKACEQSSQFANAFYFAQRWLYEEPNNIEANETLIRLSSHFGQKKLMKGISQITQKRIDISKSPAWFELIGEWGTARKIYLGENNYSNFSKIVRCLKHEQLWDDIISRIDEFNALKQSIKQNSSKFIAAALFHRQKWTELNDVLSMFTPNSVKVLTISALYLHSQGRSEEAKETIERAFDMLAANSRGTIKHDRALLNKLIVKSQQLHEVLEIVTFSDNDNDSNLIELWERRIQKCPKTFEFYYQLLSVRLNRFPVSTLLKPVVKMLKYALDHEQCSKFNSSLNYLFPTPSKWPVYVAFLHARSMWLQEKRDIAIQRLDEILKNPFFIPQIEDNQKLKSRMYYTYGQWLIDSTPLNSISKVLKKAVTLLEISMRTKIRHYNSFHRWAWACSLMYSRANQISAHACSAIHGFLECIKLRAEAPFSDLIQMISLFFKANLDEKSFDEISQRIDLLHDSAFLMIIPQLFAQITCSNCQQSNESNNNNSNFVSANTVSKFVAKIIMKILPKHYHALILQLLFERPTTNKMISDITNWFSTINYAAVSQGLIISDGLIACSTSTLENWLNDTVSAIAMIQHNGWATAFEIVKQSCLISQTTTSNLVENADIVDSEIVEMFRNALQTIEAKSVESIKKLRLIHNKIKRQLLDIRSLQMHAVCPSLFMLRNSVIAVPGSYNIGSPIVYIKQFDPTLEVYHSKQRPRFLVIYGNDGSRHRSLLKGREDLRLDNRLMQFFMLINQHISNDFKNESKQTRIFRYSITPISRQCGLIQFVDGADTIFSLITEYRRNRGEEVFAELNIEAIHGPPNIDSIQPIQRIEILREASDRTSDNDLKDIIWLKSTSSKEWMERTIRFAQSNGLMSIVGHILGIGDRHPSNLLIHRYTGSVIHIDFGDSFETSKKRRIFPELIPFRLTRMMIKSFGPAGIEGDFRITCEETMKMMQMHIYSIMAVLDIFSQEPLEGALKSGPKNSIPSSLNGSTENNDTPSSDLLMIYSENEEENEIDAKLNMKESIKRISEKIIGKDFLADNPNSNYSIENHVSYLIQSATDEYNLAHLYHGWTPLW